MSHLLLEMSTAGSLLIVVAVALSLMPQMRNAHGHVRWPLRKQTRVMATITDVNIKQDWKEGERWQRDAWDGSLVRQRTWQTSYHVTAQWMHAQTKQRYTFHSKVWADEVAKTPTTGHTLVFIVDLRHPQHYAVDWQSLS